MENLEPSHSPSPISGEGGARRTKSGGRVRGRRELLLERAREMRSNPTPAEKRLWSMLRDRRLPSYKFKRQVIIEPYIVDFVCFELRLVVEADGSQHAESESDLRRDAFLKSQGFSVLRFWNNDVLENPVGVFDSIYSVLTTPHPPTALQWAPPSPARGEGL